MPTNSHLWRWPLLASIAALAGSPLLEIVTGQGALYLLWLTVLMAVLWFAQRLTRREVGLVLGDGISYLVAFGYVPESSAWWCSAHGQRIRSICRSSPP